MAGRRQSNDRLKPAKQEDVAIEAGVSTATVSLVLSGRTDRVSEATRQRVLDAVRRLGYKAPPMDLRSREPHTHHLGMLVPDLTEAPISRDLVFRETLDSVLSTALLRGWSVTVMAERLWTDDGQTIRRAYDGRFDGVLIMLPQDDELTLPLVERGIPVVHIGSPARIERVSSVDVDNFRIGQEAVEHLYAHGHRKLAFAGKSAYATSRERRAGFMAAAERLGIPVASFDFESFAPKAEAKSQLPQWIEAGCTGVFAWSDDTACCVYAAATSMGLRIPQDLSVVAANDGRAGTLRPPLTTFRLPLEPVGRRAVEMLLGQILTGVVTDERVLYPAEFIERKSVAPPR